VGSVLRPVFVLAVARLNGGLLNEGRNLVVGKVGEGRA